MPGMVPLLELSNLQAPAGERVDLAFVDFFVDAVEGGTAPEVGFEDGRQALILAEAAYRSLAEGRLVQVSEIDQ